MQKVAAVKVDSFDYNYKDVENGINEALVLLGGLDKFISQGDKVLLKPNMLEGVDKGTGVITHPQEVTQVPYYIELSLNSNLNRFDSG